MEIHLFRTFKAPGATMGSLYVNGKFFCHTLEPTDRMYKEGDSLSVVLRKKILGRTAVPPGRYLLDFRPSAKFGFVLPFLVNVTGFDGIAIHPGNSSRDTAGCILVGHARLPNSLEHSRLTFNQLMSVLTPHSEPSYITIWDNQMAV